MAIGDQNDIFQRLKSVLVPWFGDTTPILDAFLKGGFGTTGSFIYSLYLFLKAQTRIKTATGDFLDLIAKDFFGNTLVRYTGELDSSFRTRILSSLLQEKATRKGMIDVLTKLTGRSPAVLEGFYPTDTLYYDNNFFYDVTFNGGYGFSQAYTAIIYAYRPKPIGLLNIGGYDVTAYGGFGYDFNFNNAFVDVKNETIFITDADIINAIQNTKMFGTLMLTTIFN